MGNFFSKLKNREEFEGGLEKRKGKGGERRKKEGKKKRYIVVRVGQDSEPGAETLGDWQDHRADVERAARYRVCHNPCLVSVTGYLSIVYGAPCRSK